MVSFSVPPRDRVDAAPIKTPGSMIRATPNQQLTVAASQSERRYATGTARPLEGVPILVGDLIDTRDIETRYGSAIYHWLMRLR